VPISAVRGGAQVLPNSDARPINRPQHVQAPDPTTAPKSTETVSFAATLNRVGKEMNAGEGLIEKATHATSAMPLHEVVALQAGMYRYTETLTVVSKSVDGLTNGLKTVLQKGE